MQKIVIEIEDAEAERIKQAVKKLNDRRRVLADELERQGKTINARILRRPITLETFAYTALLRAVDEEVAKEGKC